MPNNRASEPVSSEFATTDFQSPLKNWTRLMHLQDISQEKKIYCYLRKMDIVISFSFFLAYI